LQFFSRTQPFVVRTAAFDNGTIILQRAQRAACTMHANEPLLLPQHQHLFLHCCSRAKLPLQNHRFVRNEFHVAELEPGRRKLPLLPLQAAASALQGAGATAPQQP
jgi:hypothetical protein